MTYYTLNKSPTRSTSRSIAARTHSQNIQKELEYSTKALEIEKRRYLYLEQEHKKILKVFDEEKYQLNDLLRQTTTNSVKSIPIKAINTMHLNTKIDSENESIMAKIRQIRDEITVLRKYRQKHVTMTDRLNEELKSMEETIKDTDSRIDSLKQTNDFIKADILDCRSHTISDIKHFKSSLASLTQNYFDDKKMLDGQLKLSRTKEPNEIHVNALPILKERLRALISRNKQKMKIVTDYKKACIEVSKMFELMKEYKGKDDLDFIARYFVEKENTIDKLYEYIDQLESRLKSLQSKKHIIKLYAREVGYQLSEINEHLVIRRSQKDTAEQLKSDIKDIDRYTYKIQKKFDYLAPSFQRALLALRESKHNKDKDSPEDIKINFSLMKSNVLKALGEIEKYMIISQPKVIRNTPKWNDDYDDRKRELYKPAWQPEELEAPRQELLNYEKLRELAEYIIGRRSSITDSRKR